MKFLCVLFFIAIVHAQTGKEESKEKRDLFLPPIRQTVVRPAMINRVVQPIIKDVVQPVITQKSFQTFVNPVRVQNFGMQNTMFSNGFVKRSAEMEESKEKRDLFLTPIRQTVVRPAMINRVVQPIIKDVVQPVITQKSFQTFVNPVRVQNFGMQNTMFSNGFVKRSAEMEESKEKRFVLIKPGFPVVRPVFQPVFKQKIVNIVG